MAYQLKSERPDIPYEDVVEKFDLKVLRHIVEDVFDDRLRVTYDTPVIAEGRCSVACTVRDILTEKELTRPGETSCAGADAHPVEEAYDRAFSRAAMQFLKLSVTEVKTEPVQPAEDAAGPEAQEFPDDTVILFGICKGRRLGDVKDTPQFQHFLEQVVAARELSFPDEARKEQVKLLRKYAAERSGDEQEE